VNVCDGFANKEGEMMMRNECVSYEKIPLLTSRYQVSNWPGVAVWVKGWVVEKRVEEVWIQDPDGLESDEDFEVPGYWEGEEIEEHTGMIGVVMVGDDHIHHIDPDDLQPCPGYCIECGQIGCGCMPTDEDEAEESKETLERFLESLKKVEMHNVPQ
jgi:hypothetical protein